MRDVNALHLEQKQLQLYHHQYRTHPASLVVIDDFLQSEFASRCTQFLQSQAVYKDVYGLYTRQQGANSKQAWLRASPSTRFFFYQMLGSTIGKVTIGSTGLSFLKLRQLLHTKEFKYYLQALVGEKLGQATPIKVHRMQPQHFLKKHDDRYGNRRIAFILYLSSTWKAEFGGQLELIDRQKQTHSITPNFNRLLVFDVSNHSHHYISRIVNPIPNPQASRLSINGWFLNVE